MTASRGIRVRHKSMESKNDHFNLHYLMRLWAENKHIWRETCPPFFTVNETNFEVEEDHFKHSIIIHCGKFTWVEYYEPNLITAKFGEKGYDYGR